ncbi:MAG: helix-turn-helix domain-containing protein [Propionibacteriales bacterium]|nr:helix-turn-helix domain-containing protein [Propionibacteriales bacterium]
MVAPLLNVREAARLLNVSRATVYRLMASDALASYKIGAQRRLRHADIEIYLDNCR